MKIKAIIATIISVVAINGAVAGSSWTPSGSAKGGNSIVDHSPSGGGAGQVGVEYLTDYIFRGIRFSRDSLALNVNYAFAGTSFVTPTIGVRHVSSLSSSSDLLSGDSGGGDQTNVYISSAFKPIFGFETTLRSDYYFYPNLRTASGSDAQIGDSHRSVSLALERDVLFGLRFGYDATYDFGAPNFGPFTDEDDGAWFHTFVLSKSLNLGGSALDLSGGAYYSDGVFNPNNNSNAAFFGSGTGGQGNSGWHSYFIEAALPISLNHNATLTPYIGYLGTPDTWVADGLTDDVLHGGVRFGLNF